MSLNKAFAKKTKEQVHDLDDPAQFQALPFVFSQPNLTQSLLETLQNNVNTKADSIFKWHVKPGDHVAADTPIGTYHLLAPQILRKPLNPQIYAPADCVITFLAEPEEVLSAETLFSYQRLFPTADLHEFMESSPDTSRILKLQKKPDAVFWNVFPALYALKRPEDRSKSSAQIDKFLAEEKAKMKEAASLTPPYHILPPEL